MNYRQRRKQPFVNGILNKFIRNTYLRNEKSIRVNPNISKYWELGELKVLVLNTKVMSSKHGTNFLL